MNTCENCGQGIEYGRLCAMCRHAASPEGRDYVRIPDAESLADYCDGLGRDLDNRVDALIENLAIGHGYIADSTVTAVDRAARTITVRTKTGRVASTRWDETAGAWVAA